ncbi:hypothetical protein [Merismopedia glauca]|uniref:DUF4149 domain-containing protein n=1 Tax=Merismopedia glauca CCAP 1448/3 TaxID=1296344 RepID=A0A2T1CA37_9CYAN|nr:hypothetical protein [Merismopedia glauca]PSB05132.1 hypothetical protein C7B64_00890 [Merismopedia glauca CCAP 1448/3]
MNFRSDFRNTPSKWVVIILSALSFWLSASLVIDLLIMPTLYATGMMSQDGFATAGYTIFGIFNRVELVCAALILTGLLALQNQYAVVGKSWQNLIVLAAILLDIVLGYTYFLTPHMSALGMKLNLFDTANSIPNSMNQMHTGYWLLEIAKIVIVAILLKLVYRQQSAEAKMG